MKISHIAIIAGLILAAIVGSTFSAQKNPTVSEYVKEFRPIDFEDIRGSQKNPDDTPIVSLSVDFCEYSGVVITKPNARYLLAGFSFYADHPDYCLKKFCPKCERFHDWDIFS